MSAHARSRPTALIVDYGGVLTGPLADAMGQWCDADGIDPADFGRVIRDLLVGPREQGTDDPVNPVHALERGELEIPDFETQLADRLRTRDGQPVPADGLLTRMFAGFQRAPAMVSVVRRLRRAGIRTALLSNSWGLDYPRHDWADLFDVTVVSGEVGMRKPEPEIYRYTAELLGCPPQECVFVDDLPPNVRGAVAVGMVGVRHVDPQVTIDELSALFGLPLTDELTARSRG